MRPILIAALVKLCEQIASEAGADNVQIAMFKMNILSAVRKLCDELEQNNHVEQVCQN